MSAYTTEPPCGLAWDVRTKDGCTSWVMHIGTKKTCAALRRRKQLPNYEEVKTVREQKTTAPQRESGEGTNPS